MTLFLIWGLAAWLSIYVLGRIAVAVLKLIVAAFVIAAIFGLCSAMGGCSWPSGHDEELTVHDAYDTWHKGCVTGSQQWTVTQDETGQNKAFIVVCSSVVGQPSHMPRDGGSSL